MNTVLHGLTYVTAFGPVWVVLVTLVGLPLANEIVQRSPARAQSLIQFIAHLVLSLPGVGPLIAKFPVLGDLLYVFAPQDKTGIPTPLLYRPSKSNNLSSPPAPPAVPPAALLVFFLVGLSAFTGCAACKLSQNATLPKCVLENNIIACGEQDGASLLPVVLSVVESVVAGSFNPAAVVATLEGQGVKDVPCVLAALEQYVAPTNPALSITFHAVLKEALAKRGSHGDVVVKLKSGATVHAVVP